MTKKKQNKQNKAKQAKQPMPVKQSKPTPFSDVGSIVGKSVGRMFNMPHLGGVGRWLGSGIGSIFGSGDYTMVGDTPSYNVLTNGSQIPKFNTTRQSNIVCHREYLGDIQGTSLFNNIVYPLNPGISTTFPWLSGIATNYQEYKFHGLVFEFRSLITDFVTSGAPGAIVMATNYNADATVYTTKQQMENAEYTVSSKPTMNLIHGVECAPQQTVLPQAYIRNGPVPTGQDLRLYDQGNFQFATVGNPTQDLGELWVSYCVEFFKPTQNNGTVTALSSKSSRAGAASASPFGTSTLSTSGPISATFTTTSMTWPGIAGQKYLITMLWTGGVSASVVPGLGYGANTNPISLLINDTSSAQVSPNPGASSSAISLTATVQFNGITGNPASVTLNTSGTYLSGPIADFIITLLDSTVV